jgi:hypothetical protein
MHPHTIEGLAEARRRELRAAARPARTARQPSRTTKHSTRHRGSARRRAGWLLIEIGLRLAGGTQSRALSHRAA